MRRVYTIFAVLQCSVTWATWPWAGPHRAIIRSTPVRKYLDPNNFDPTQLLDASLPKPDIWEKALAELQSLKNKPSCSRLAAIMLMNDCRLLEKHDDYSDRNSASETEHSILDHINSYAASLAICDLEAARAPIPESCEPFRDTALLVAGRGGGGTLHVSHEQIGLCMNGLVSDQSSWTSWNSNRDRAMIICRASRIDIDKEETLSLHEDTIKIFSEVVKEFKIELQKRKELLAEQDDAMKSYFYAILANFNKLNDGISVASSNVAKHFKHITKILTTTLDKAEDTEKLFNRLQNSMVKSNTEHDSAQERALAATNGLAVGAKNARTEVELVLRLLSDVAFNINSMEKRVSTIQQRQKVMDVQSARVLLEMANLTKQLQVITSLSDDHIVDIENAKRATLDLVDLAEGAIVSLSRTSTLLTPSGPLGINWALMVIAPLMTVTLGGYGLPASVFRNLALMGCGLVIAKLLTVACNSQWHLTLGNSFGLTQSVVSDPVTPISLIRTDSLLNETT